MAIDTLEYVKKLEAAGVDRRQAEAHASALKDVVVPDLATRADLDRLAAATKHDLIELEMRLIKYMIAQGAAVAGIVIAALRFLR